MQSCQQQMLAFSFQRGVATVLTGDLGMEASCILQNSREQSLTSLDIVSKLFVLFIFLLHYMCLCVWGGEWTCVCECSSC